MRFRQCAQLCGRRKSSARPLFRRYRSLIRLATDDRLRAVEQWPHCSILVPATGIGLVGTVSTVVTGIDAASVDVDGSDGEREPCYSGHERDSGPGCHRDRQRQWSNCDACAGAATQSGPCQHILDFSKQLQCGGATRRNSATCQSSTIRVRSRCGLWDGDSDLPGRGAWTDVSDGQPYKLRRGHGLHWRRGQLLPACRRQLGTGRWGRSRPTASAIDQRFPATCGINSTRGQSRPFARRSRRR